MPPRTDNRRPQPEGAAAAGRAGRWLRRWGGVAAGAITLGIALRVVHNELASFQYADIVTRLRALPRASVLEALAWTAAAYAILPAYDLLALRYVGHRLGRSRAVFAASTAFAVSQTLGFPLLTGGSVRYRLWSSWGMNTAQIVLAIAFSGLTFTAGVVAVSGTLILAAPAEAATLLHLPFGVTLTAGVLLAATTLTYVALAWRLRGAFVRVFGREIAIPRPSLAVMQVMVPQVDWLVAAAVLYVLLPPSGPGFLAFTLAFTLAHGIGLVTHVPGGLGVFEGVMLVLLRPYVPADRAMAALLAYRATYYLLPFALALLALVGFELRAHRHHVRSVVTLAERVSSFAVPIVLSGAVFAAGIVLLVSGATPSVGSRLAFLSRLLPLGVIELSHFAASVIGATLLVLAWGLRRRLDAAWLGTVVLLALGVLASFLKGFDWEEAVILSAVLLVLIPARRRFTRPSALLSEPMRPEWIIAVVVVLAGTTWLGLFSFKHVQYRPELWWQFTRHGDASRFLRASVGAGAVLVVGGLARLFRAADAQPAPPGDHDLARAATVAASSPDTMAWLALLGDKSLLFSQSGRAMLMYGVRGRSWIALGDPIGPVDEREELAWRFTEMAQAHGAWPVFYEVKPDALPLYVELGLTLIKVGEEALVPIAGFSLDGGARSALRRAHRDASRRGATFRVIPRDDVPAALPALRRVSDEWLAGKRVREKGFSLGRWDERYVSRFPVAVVECDGEIVAFANLWLGAPGTELSLDLMRQGTRAPRSCMEFMLIETILWGRGRGFSTFSLGMAPMAGLVNRDGAPLWSRAGSYLFAHGNALYNFQGLRAFKEKFRPVWRPRFMASPGGIALPRILTNVATIVSGGVRGIVMR